MGAILDVWNDDIIKSFLHCWYALMLQLRPAFAYLLARLSLFNLHVVSGMVMNPVTGTLTVISFAFLVKQDCMGSQLICSQFKLLLLNLDVILLIAMNAGTVTKFCPFNMVRNHNYIITLTNNSHKSIQIITAFGATHMLHTLSIK